MSTSPHIIITAVAEHVHVTSTLATDTWSAAEIVLTCVFIAMSIVCHGKNFVTYIHSVYTRCAGLAAGAGLPYAPDEPALVYRLQCNEGCRAEGSSQAAGFDLLDSAQLGGSVQCV